MADARSRQQWAHTSHILWVIAEVNRDRKKRSQPFKPGDFNPCHEPRRREKAAMRVGVEFLRSMFIDRQS